MLGEVAREKVLQPEYTFLTCTLLAMFADLTKLPERGKLPGNLEKKWAGSTEQCSCINSELVQLDQLIATTILCCVSVGGVGRKSNRSAGKNTIGRVLARKLGIKARTLNYCSVYQAALLARFLAGTLCLESLEEEFKEKKRHQPL